MLSIEFGKPNRLQPDLSEAHFCCWKSDGKKIAGVEDGIVAPVKINYNLFHTIDFLNV